MVARVHAPEHSITEKTKSLTGIYSKIVYIRHFKRLLTKKKI